MRSMKDIYDLLKQFGIYIYTSDRLGDLVLMEDEVRELYKARVLDVKDYQMAILILRQEATRLESKKKSLD